MSSDPTEALFAYGTLLDEQVQLAVIGRAIPGVPDRLAAYRKTRVPLGGVVYPDLVEDPDGHVEGRVLLVTEDELARMDEYEGDEYVRIKVRLGSGATAWVYRTDRAGTRFG
jgi:gamma-glutamylcyclotransferase (GGCT)/AIG2-like uncharacterized protein YtfP